ncbi:MAG TPA: NAD-dependent epimerase/dehydratase family protein, partial [Gemmatimonadaceae bacterium]|nr:NAD-dependent epimerase/dehydratase family protein [Gemmatimonadaceae bacterium]
MKTIAITGGYGFLGWHTAARLRATQRVNVLRLGREDFRDSEILAKRLRDVDTILHFAGVNRADSEGAVEQGNRSIAATLAGAIARNAAPVHVVNANSVQSRGDSAYGLGKAGSAELARKAAKQVGGTLQDVVLPNLFGEHGLPAYNSFVATFCHEVAAGRRPRVSGDREIPLLHAQAAAQVIIDAAADREDGMVEPLGDAHSVSEVLEMI